MAKSIYDILTDLTTETSVPDHGIIKHSLPAELLPTAEDFEHEEALLEWAKETGVTHACLQKGVQKFLIDLRAIFKATKKDEKWSLEKGQKAVNEAEWNVTKRPKVGNAEVIKQKAIYDANLAIAKSMKATKNVTADMILNVLTDSCGEDMAVEIINSL